MICPKCGEENEKQDHSCQHCGTQLVSRKRSIGNDSKIDTQVLHKVAVSSEEEESPAPAAGKPTGTPCTSGVSEQEKKSDSAGEPCPICSKAFGSTAIKCFFCSLVHKYWQVSAIVLVFVVLSIVGFVALAKLNP